MHNVGDYIKASDVAVPAGAVLLFYNVTLSGRYPIFWGSTVVDTGWVVCDGGSDFHGGNVPDLANRFIMGATSVSTANKIGGSNSFSGNVGYTTLTINQIPSHAHAYIDYYGYALGSGDLITYGRGGGKNEWAAPKRTATSYYTGGSSSHTHSFSGTLTPPYYSLIYCVKLI